jgi:putative transposon-encoded protein
MYTWYNMQKKLKFELIVNEGDEMIERDIKKFGNASHIILPQKHIGKKATIIIAELKKI